MSLFGSRNIILSNRRASSALNISIVIQRSIEMCVHYSIICSAMTLLALYWFLHKELNSFRSSHMIRLAHHPSIIIPLPPNQNGVCVDLWTPILSASAASRTLLIRTFNNKSRFISFIFIYTHTHTNTSTVKYESVFRSSKNWYVHSIRIQ